MSNSLPLVIYCIPSLVSVLHEREREKGSPLTEEEVLAIRNGAVAVKVPEAVAKALDLERGYKDIDPVDCWEQWQEVRLQLATADTADTVVDVT